MQRHIGIPANAYYQGTYGRTCNSPICHLPDYCPIFPGTESGDCHQHCAHLEYQKRPCYLEAKRKREGQSMADQKEGLCKLNRQLSRFFFEEPKKKRAKSKTEQYLADKKASLRKRMLSKKEVDKEGD